MAQPRDYTRQYNFNDFQATNPDDPLPGNQIDAELNTVKLTLDDLNANIAKIQRDDGKLGNAAVHKDAFDQGALAIINSDFTPRGDWVTAREYAVNDAVDFNGSTYVATVAHTSSSAFATDDAADRWILIANAAIAGTAAAVDKFEGDGATTVFTLSYNYQSETAVQVFVNGELLNPVDDYTLSGNQLTMYTAPGAPTVAGNENVIVWGASVVAQAAASTAESHEANASGYADEAEAWASKTNGIVESTDYSSKAWATGGTGVDGGDGSAKDWAVKLFTPVGNTQEYSAKYWATSTNVVSVATNITDVNTVASQIAPSNNVQTLAGISANITTAAGIHSDITTVAGISGDVTTVANDGADIGVVASISADVQTLADVQDGTVTQGGISTLAGIAANITTVANNNTNVSTVATNIQSVNTVATNITAVTAVANDLAEAISEVEVVAADLSEAVSEIETVANNIANVNTVGDNMSHVTAVSGIASAVSGVNAISTAVSNVNSNATNINAVNTNSANINAVAVIATDVATVAGIEADVVQTAANFSGIADFAATYKVSATPPTGIVEGTLWFDTHNDIMKVYDGNAWSAAGSAVNGTAESQNYTVGTASGSYTGSTTVFPATYEQNFVHVWLNGVKLDNSDFVAVNGSTITLNSAATNGDVISIVAFGTFTAANHYTMAASDARYVQADSNLSTFVNAFELPTADGTAGQFMKTDGSGNLSFATVDTETTLKQSFLL